MLSIIVATDKNKGIGYKNSLPWHYPEDLAYFKQVTQGHSIIMGKNTFLSIGRALPQRKNYVITSDETLAENYANIELIHNPITFFEQAQKAEEELFIIGGSKIYELSLPYIQRLYITEIKEEHKVDCYFPAYDLTAFHQVSEQESGILTYKVYERKEK